MPKAMRDASAILEAYQMMLVDPTLHERIEQRRSARRRSAPSGRSPRRARRSSRCSARGDAGDRDAYIRERRHDVEFVCDRLLRALVGDDGAASPCASTSR